MSYLLQMTAPVVDMVYSVRALPVSGQEAEVTGFSITPGGGFNAMAAARAAGKDVRLGGSLGTGPMSLIVAEALERLGINRGRERLEGIDQGCCTVLLEPDGERSFVGYPGAEGRITKEDLFSLRLDDVSEVLLSGYTLHYTGAREAVVAWISDLPEHIDLFFDPSPVASRLPAPILDPVVARADWISANSVEAEVVTGLPEAKAAIIALAKGRKGALLRQGGNGCLLAMNGEIHPVAPLKVQAVDTNGAGDCHIGSFIAELYRCGDALAAARYANVAAALSTTRYGPATPPTRAEVAQFL